MRRRAAVAMPQRRAAVERVDVHVPLRCRATPPQRERWLDTRSSAAVPPKTRAGVRVTLLLFALHPPAGPPSPQRASWAALPLPPRCSSSIHVRRGPVHAAPVRVLVKKKLVFLPISMH